MLYSEQKDKEQTEYAAQAVQARRRQAAAAVAAQDTMAAEEEDLPTLVQAADQLGGPAHSPKLTTILRAIQAVPAAPYM